MSHLLQSKPCDGKVLEMRHTHADTARHTIVSHHT
jgi:hypothetical protein